MTILLVHLVDSAVSDSGSPLAIDADAGAPGFIRGRELEVAFRCNEVAVSKESLLYCLGFMEEGALSSEVGFSEGEKRCIESAKEVHGRGP